MTIIQTSFRFRRVWFDIYTSLAMDDLDPAGWGAALYSFFQNCQYRNENLVKKKKEYSAQFLLDYGLDSIYWELRLAQWCLALPFTSGDPGLNPTGALCELGFSVPT